MRKISKSMFGVIILLFTFVIGITFTLTTYFNSRFIDVNYNVETIAINEFDFTQILEKFDEINLLPHEDENIKAVETTFKLAGSSLDDIHYTSNIDEQNISVSSLTTIDEITDYGILNMTLDYGDCQDYVQAEGYGVSYENGQFYGTIVVDGVEYDVNEVVKATYGEDGTQECWFWVIVKIIVVVVNIYIAAVTVYDIYKYFTAEEVTIRGVVSIVAEGLVCAAASALTCGIGASLAKSGFKVIKKGKKVSGKAQNLLGRNAKTILNERTKLVKQGKRYFKHSYSYSVGKNSIREAYTKQKVFKDFNWTNSKSEDYVQIHHIVEQNQAGTKFKAREIHTDLNTIGIPKVMHEQISGIYSSSTKHLNVIEEIFGKNFFDGKTTFRSFVQSKSFEEQYEIGMKVVQYFIGKKSANGTNYFILNL